MRTVFRRALPIIAAFAVLFGISVVVPAAPAHAAQPLALVYRGPAACSGCPESVAKLLRTSPQQFRVEYVGPNDGPITAVNLARARVYAQPGGPSLSTGWNHMKNYATVIRNYIATGGRYLGFCLGGYLAGATPGFNLLPGDTSRYYGTPGASITTPNETVSTVLWRGVSNKLYFEDPPKFDLVAGNPATILARYTSGHVAALVTPYGAGRVGVVGPHPEADLSWFSGGLNPTGAIHPELGHDLLTTTLS